MAYAMVAQCITLIIQSSVFLSISLSTLLSIMTLVAEAFTKFLNGVDEPSAPEAVVAELAGVLEKEGMMSPADLKGCTPNDVPNGLRMAARGYAAEPSQ